MVLTPAMLYYGGRADSVTLVAGSITEDSTSGHFDSTWSDCQIVPGVQDCFDTLFTDDSNAAVTVGVGHTAYLHYTMYIAAAMDNDVAWTMRDGSNNPWIRLIGQAGYTQKLQYNSGTGGSPTWTDVSGATTTGLSINGVTSAFDFAVSVVSGGAHTVSMYYNNTLIWTYTVTISSMTTIGRVRWGYPGGGLSGFSQIMATQDQSTVAGHVKTIRATGAGTYGQWTGAYTDVNEVVTSDATYNQATANNLLQSYAMGDISLPAGYTIASLRQCIRVKNDGANSPLNVDALVRSGGTDYTSSNLSGINAGYTGLSSPRYPTDPNTSAAWTQSGINAVELGFKSAA